MKLLCVQPGASYSTADVYEGLLKELQMLGHEAVEYNLDVRIARANSWLYYNWEQAEKNGQVIPRPGPADVVYLACSESILMALRHLPDWVLIVSGMYFHPDAMIMLKRAGQKIAVILTESPYDDERQAKILPYADVVFTNDLYTAQRFGRMHRQVHYLPHAYDPGKHSPVGNDDDDVPAHDVVFVGTGFRERIDLLAQIDWTGIDLGLYGTYDLLEEMPEAREKLEPFIKGEIVDNRKAASLYRRAKIGLNLHRTSMGFGLDVPRIEAAYSMNPRMIELAADGCFIVSDPRPAVSEVFGDLVPTFETPSQAESLVRRWLKDEAGRIAVSCQLPEVVASHTFAARAANVSRILMAEGERLWLDTTERRDRSTSLQREAAQPAQQSR